MDTRQSEYLRRLQETASRLQEIPLADAIGTCIAELRTPLTVVSSYGQLLATMLTYPEDCRTLVDIVVQQSKVIIDVHIADELVDFQRMIRNRFPPLNDDPLGAHIELLRYPWDSPLDDALLRIAHNIRDAGTRIRQATGQFQMLCASQLSPETSEYMMTIEQFTYQLLVVVELLLEGLLLARIRRECMDNI